MHDVPTIQLAVRNCVALCVQTEYPLTCLSDFLEGLRESHWHREEIAIVERQVLKALVDRGNQQPEKASEPFDSGPAPWHDASPLADYPGIGILTGPNPRVMVMASAAAPKCPKCGSSDSKLLSSKDGFLNEPPAIGEKPISTVNIYLCPCGATFEQMVKHPPCVGPPR